MESILTGAFREKITRSSSTPSRAEGGIGYIRTALPLHVSIKQGDDKIHLACADVSGKRRDIPSDMVVLCPAMIPAKDTPGLSKLLGIVPDKDGFFAEGHTKLAPVSTNINGIFIAGCSQGPKDIQNSVAQGAAAAGQILSSLVPGRKLELEVTTAEIDENACSGCMTCVAVCPYKAIAFDNDKKVSVVNPALCKGCGTCVAACPSGSAKSRHFTGQQILTEIEEVLK